VVNLIADRWKMASSSSLNERLHDECLSTHLICSGFLEESADALWHRRARMKSHVEETRGDVRTLWGRLYGQEKNLTTSAIARMDLYLHGAA
jgi:hypothetical protein